MSCAQTCPPCPPPPPPCTTPPPLPPCRHKPVMRGLHLAQTKRNLMRAIGLAALVGASYYVFVAAPRIAKYKEYHANNDFEEWADEMARKGLFQSVPVETLRD